MAPQNKSNHYGAIKQFRRHFTAYGSFTTTGIQKVYVLSDYTRHLLSQSYYGNNEPLFIGLEPACHG